MTDYKVESPIANTMPSPSSSWEMYEEMTCSVLRWVRAGTTTIRWTIPVATSLDLGTKSIVSSAVRTDSFRCATISRRMQQLSSRRKLHKPEPMHEQYALSATLTSVVSMPCLTPSPTMGAYQGYLLSQAYQTMKLSLGAAPSKNAMTSSSKT